MVSTLERKSEISMAGRARKRIFPARGFRANPSYASRFDRVGRGTLQSERDEDAGKLGQDKYSSAVHELSTETVEGQAWITWIRSITRTSPGFASRESMASATPTAPPRRGEALASGRDFLQDPHGTRLDA